MAFLIPEILVFPRLKPSILVFWMRTIQLKMIWLRKCLNVLLIIKLISVCPISPGYMKTVIPERAEMLAIRINMNYWKRCLRPFGIRYTELDGLKAQAYSFQVA